MSQQLSDELESKSHLKTVILTSTSHGDHSPNHQKSLQMKPYGLFLKTVTKTLMPFTIALKKMENDIEHLLEQLEQGRGNAVQIFATD